MVDVWVPLQIFSMVIEIPRYKCKSVSILTSLYWWADFVLEWEIFSTKHFLASNYICQLSCHNESVFKSVCKCSTSELLWMGRYITQSSANKQTSDVILSGRLFIHQEQKWAEDGPLGNARSNMYPLLMITIHDNSLQMLNQKVWNPSVSSTSYTKVMYFVKQSVVRNCVKPLAKVHYNHIDRCFGVYGLTCL